MLIFEVNSAELIKSIEGQALSAGVVNAAIVSLIGAVDSFAVSTMPAHDAKQDVISGYLLPAEVHGAGEIRDGKVHLHATFAVQGDRAIAGHVHNAQVGVWFMRAYVIPVPPSRR